MAVACGWKWSAWTAPGREGVALRHFAAGQAAVECGSALDVVKTTPDFDSRWRLNGLSTMFRLDAPHLFLRLDLFKNYSY
jgi:hypothetical protein